MSGPLPTKMARLDTRYEISLSTPQPRENFPLHTLPAEILLHIFDHLNPRDLVRVGEVCKMFYTLVNDVALWRKRILADAPTKDKKWMEIAGYEKVSYKNQYIKFNQIFIPTLSKIFNKENSVKKFSWKKPLQEVLNDYKNKSIGDLQTFGPPMAFNKIQTRVLIFDIFFENNFDLKRVIDILTYPHWSPLFDGDKGLIARVTLFFWFFHSRDPIKKDEDRRLSACVKSIDSIEERKIIGKIVLSNLEMFELGENSPLRKLVQGWGSACQDDGFKRSLLMDKFPEIFPDPVDRFLFVRADIKNLRYSATPKPYAIKSLDEKDRIYALSKVEVINNFYYLRSLLSDAELMDTNLLNLSQVFVNWKNRGKMFLEAELSTNQRKIDFIQLFALEDSVLMQKEIIEFWMNKDKLFTLALVKARQRDSCRFIDSLLEFSEHKYPVFYNDLTSLIKADFPDKVRNNSTSLSASLLN